jgi:hypothetical protein
MILDSLLAGRRLKRCAWLAGRAVELPVCLRLSCQQFVELIRRGQIMEAVTFAQQVADNPADALLNHLAATF